ncbi:MAG: transposase [Eubacterium sp.]|nr:transposase [Eubacterium sp.]
MNSDFQEAFEEKYYWIQPVFDYFHIVKNFNDKVVSEVRKDGQRTSNERAVTKQSTMLCYRRINFSLPLIWSRRNCPLLML